MKIILVVREPDSAKPEYSLEFDLPSVPEIGSYISVQRPDKPEPFGEDMVVRRVWWRLAHPTTGGFESEPRKLGSMTEIYVECDPAIGPWSSENWRRALERHPNIERFDVARLNI